MSDAAVVANKVIANVEKVIVGKRQQLTLALVAFFCEGHLLLEDVPGVAKTMLARALARSVGCSFKRVQCTPDLLPSDITGVSVFKDRKSTRLNSSHSQISYAVFCLKKKKKTKRYRYIAAFLSYPTLTTTTPNTLSHLVYTQNIITHSTPPKHSSPLHSHRPSPLYP